MEHELHFSGETAQVVHNETPILRGYDPLQEIGQWNIISSLLVSELILVGAASVSFYNNEFMLTGGAFWSIRPGIFVPLLLLLGTFPCFFTYRSYRREKQERATLRHDALIVNAAGQAQPEFQPLPVSQRFPLPMQIESRPKKLLTTPSVIGGSLFVAAILMNCIMLLASSWEVPLLLSIIVMFMGMVSVISFGPGIGRDMRLRIAGHYLLPSLTIDDVAITARYGHDTITIAWHDIRHFALVSSATFRSLPGSKIISKREAFEISDSENIICWLKAEPLSSHRLFRFGEVALSDEDYAAFTQQLAALIMARTGLPLYDLRLAKHKK
jgi:hypothetical protein